MDSYLLKKEKEEERIYNFYLFLINNEFCFIFWPAIIRQEKIEKIVPPPPLRADTDQRELLKKEPPKRSLFILLSVSEARISSQKWRTRMPLIQRKTEELRRAPATMYGITCWGTCSRSPPSTFPLYSPWVAEPTASSGKLTILMCSFFIFIYSPISYHVWTMREFHLF